MFKQIIKRPLARVFSTLRVVKSKEDACGVNMYRKDLKPIKIE